MTATAIVGIIGAILAVMGALGVAYAVFRSATVQKTLDLYRSENEALGKAVARQQADLAALQAKAEQLETANRVLQDTVSGREAIERLTVRLTEYQADRATEHKTITSLLEDLREQISEIWQGVVRALGDRNV